MTQAERIHSALSRSRTTSFQPPVPEFKQGEDPLPPLSVSESDLLDPSLSEVNSNRLTVPHPSEETTPPLTTASIEERSSRFWKTISMVTAMTVVGGLIFLLLNRRSLPPTPTPSIPVVVASHPLQLVVVLQDDGLLGIRWNPEIATQAREGRLLITGRDGQGQTTVILTPQFLKTGRLDHPFPAGQLDAIQLEIDDPSGKTARESVTASSLGVLVSPPAERPRPVTPESTATKLPRAAMNTPIRPPLVLRETATSSRPAIRSFVPPAPTQRGKEEKHTILTEPPPILGGSAIPAGTSLPTVVNLPAPAVREIPVNRQTSVGGSTQAASLIKKVPPIYPPLAKAQHIQGTVRFAATIEKDGTIKSLRVMSGSALLVPSATAAVRQWLYRPAMVNGNPVEETTQVEVTFTLN